ncbi:hypothetical protein ACP4OV_025702 [Aristida adscensionis]
MASFAVQIKDKLVGLVERVTGYGRAAGGDKDARLEPAANLQHVQVAEIRSRGLDENGGSSAPVN